MGNALLSPSLGISHSMGSSIGGHALLMTIPTQESIGAATTTTTPAAKISCDSPDSAATLAVATSLLQYGDESNNGITNKNEVLGAASDTSVRHDKEARRVRKIAHKSKLRRWWQHAENEEETMHKEKATRGLVNHCNTLTVMHSNNSTGISSTTANLTMMAMRLLPSWMERAVRQQVINLI